MDRQLKERLIGAAVLIAVAVIMVPEMFSGSGSRIVAPPEDSAADSSSIGQVKTYHIDLQHRDSASTQTEQVTQQSPMVADSHMDPHISATSTSSSESDQSVANSSVSSASSHSVSAISSSSRSSVVQSAMQASSSKSSSSSASKSSAATTEGWTVQLGSFASEATAHQVVARTKTLGFIAHEEAVSVSGKKLYRVRVGPYPDREAAQSSLGKLKHTYPQASLVAPGH